MNKTKQIYLALYVALGTTPLAFAGTQFGVVGAKLSEGSYQIHLPTGIQSVLTVGPSTVIQKMSPDGKPIPGSAGDLTVSTAVTVTTPSDAVLPAVAIRIETERRKGLVGRSLGIDRFELIGGGVHKILNTAATKYVLLTGSSLGKATLPVGAEVELVGVSSAGFTFLAAQVVQKSPTITPVPGVPPNTANFVCSGSSCGP